MLKNSKIFSFVMLLGTLVLAGCQTRSNTITFQTPLPTASFNTTNQIATVQVQTRDLRPSAEVANYVARGQAERLMAMPTVTALFQQALQQDLNSKGFRVTQGGADAHLTVNIKTFFAEVTQGNLRYKITATVDVDVTVQGAKGQFNKHFATTRRYEGAFGAHQKEISKILGEAYQATVEAIYRDNEVSNAIHQLK